MVFLVYLTLRYIFEIGLFRHMCAASFAEKEKA